METARVDTTKPTATEGNPGTPELDGARSVQLEFMTFGDVRQMLDGGSELREVALLRGAQLARADALTAEQLADFSAAALALVDPESSGRAAEAGVRRQAILTLQEVGESVERVQSLPGALRAQIFDVLATLPSLRENPRAGDAAFTPSDYQLVESDTEVRLLADQAAKLFAPHRSS